jgi:hypothetical protein
MSTMIKNTLILNLSPDAAPSSAGLLSWIKKKFTSKAEKESAHSETKTESNVEEEEDDTAEAAPAEEAAPEAPPPVEPRPSSHRVTWSDHISMIAAKYGYRDWQTIWDKNSDLKSKRANAHCLFHGDRRAPYGDVLQLPDDEEMNDEGSTESTHSFVVPTAELYLRLQILDEELKPVKDTDYLLLVDGIFKSGKTDGQGCIQEPILRGAQFGAISIHYAGEGEEAGGDLSATEKIMFPLSIGKLDPIQEKAPDKWCIAGVQARLNNLGFDSGPVDGIKGPITTGAIKRFQKRVKISADGIPGPITQGKLHDLHDTDGTGWPQITEPGEGEVGSVEEAGGGAAGGPAGSGGAGADTSGADADDLNETVATKAEALIGSEPVGRRECYDLVDQVLTESGAKSAPDFMAITGGTDQDYIWSGTKVPLGEARRGDIIQLRDYKVKVVKDYPDGSGEDYFIENDQHCAVIVGKNEDGSLTVVDQNMTDPDTGKPYAKVRKGEGFFVSSKSYTEADGTKVKVTVSGKMWVYRPEKKALTIKKSAMMFRRME